jgi:hypothetical protein
MGCQPLFPTPSIVVDCWSPQNSTRRREVPNGDSSRSRRFTSDRAGPADGSHRPPGVPNSIESLIHGTSQWSSGIVSVRGLGQQFVRLEPFFQAIQVVVCATAFIHEPVRAHLEHVKFRLALFFAVERGNKGGHSALFRGNKGSITPCLHVKALSPPFRHYPARHSGSQYQGSRLTNCQRRCPRRGPG